jgi:hypothetical protein
MIAVMPALAQEYPQAELVEDAASSGGTAISGRAGTSTSAWPRNLNGGLMGIEWWERGDNPCQLRATTQGIGETNQATDTLFACHDNAVADRREVAFQLPFADDPAWGVFVTRLRVCMNRASSVAAARRGRLIKGIQIEGAVVLPWGAVLSASQQGETPFDAAKGNNCLADDQQAWEPWVGCSADPSGMPRFATRVVVHYEEDSGRQSPRITGLSLRCGTLRPTQARRQLVLDAPAAAADWAGLPARAGIPAAFTKTIAFGPSQNAPQRALDTIRLHDTIAENKPCRVGVVGKNVNTPWDVQQLATDCHEAVDDIDPDAAVASLGSSTYFGQAGGPQWPPNAFITAIRVCRSQLAGRPSEIKGIRLDGVTVDDLGRVMPMSGTLGRPSAELPGCVHNDLDLPHSASLQIGLSSQCGDDPRPGGGPRVATGLELHFAETQVHPISQLPVEPTALVGVRLICSSVRVLPPEMITDFQPLDPPPDTPERPVKPKAVPVPEPEKPERPIKPKAVPVPDPEKPKQPGTKPEAVPVRPPGDKGAGIPEGSADVRYGWRLGDAIPYDPEDLTQRKTVGDRGGDWGGPELSCSPGSLLTGYRINVQMIDTVNRMTGVRVFCGTVVQGDVTGAIIPGSASDDIALSWGQIQGGAYSRVGRREVIVAIKGATGNSSQLRQLSDYNTKIFQPAQPGDPEVNWGTSRELPVEGAINLTPTLFSPTSLDNAVCYPAAGVDSRTVYVARGLKLHRQGNRLRGVTVLCQELNRVLLVGPGVQ